VLPPLGALLDPTSNQLDLAFGQLPPGGDRGHAFRAIAGRDALHRFTFRGIAPDDGKMAAQVLLSIGFDIEAAWSGGSIYPVRGRCNIDPTRRAVCHEMWSLSQRSCVRISGLPRGY
jgi:hypothetical protein